MSSSSFDQGQRLAQLLFSKHGLTAFREFLKAEDFTQTQQRTLFGTRRKRIFVPEVLFWIIQYSALFGESLMGATLRLWTEATGNLPKGKRKPPSDGALSRARQRLGLRFFLRIFRTVRGRILQQYDGLMRYRGYLLAALDGSVLNLPRSKENLKSFGSQANQHGRLATPQGRLVAVVSVLTGVCLDFFFRPIRCAEQCYFVRLLRTLTPKTLLLADRGFCYYGNLIAMLGAGIDFVLRKRCQIPVRKRKRLGPGDWIVELRPSHYSRFYQRGLPESFLLRMVRSKRKGFRPTYVLTSLTDPLSWSAQEICALYHCRWRQETIYRELKHTLTIETLRSLKPLGIHQEVVAQLTLNNLIRWLMAVEAQRTGRLPIELSFQGAARALKTVLPLMAIARPSHLLALYEELLEDIARAVVRKRPDRSYPRYVRKYVWTKKSDKHSYVSQRKQIRA